MKAIIVYDLPDDEDELRVALRAMSWASAMWDMDQFLRNKLKYGHDYQNADEALEKAREQLHDILDYYSLNLDEIWTK